jgi:hypothetical protein
VAHRLNRLRIRQRPRSSGRRINAADLLQPTTRAGFDNIAGVLKMSGSPWSATWARRGSSAGWRSGARRRSRRSIASRRGPAARRIEGLPFGTRGGTLIRHVSQDAECDIKVGIIGQGRTAQQLEIQIDGERVKPSL